VTPSLRELQRSFAAAVFSDAPAILAQLRDGAFPAARTLQIYRHNVFATLAEALAACYPVTKKLVGEEFFDYLADRYLRQHPPRTGNLHEFGAALADFLAAFPSAQPLVYLPDVARLEWAWQQAYHAPDATSSALAALAAVAPGHYAKIVFHLHPSVRLVASDYPILRIWQVNQADFNGESIVRLNEGAQQLLIVRRGLDIEIEPLGIGEYAMLQAFVAGKTLARANEIALTAEPGFDLDRALRRHVAAGAMIGFTEPKQQQPEDLR
jgi:hypothetical protein